MNDRQLIITTNAALLHAVPQVISFQAMFSDLTGALEAAFEGIASHLTGKEADINIKDEIDVEVQDLFSQVINEIQAHLPEHIAEFPELVDEMNTSGEFSKVETTIEELKTFLPNLTALDQSLDNEGVMAYVAILNTGKTASDRIQAFITSFKPLFDAIEQHGED